MDKQQCPECDLYFVPLADSEKLRAHGPVHARCTQDATKKLDYRACELCGLVLGTPPGDPFPDHGPRPGERCMREYRDAQAVVETDRQELAAELADAFDVPAAVLAPPLPTPQKKGPWFSAAYDGECSGCDGAIFQGDRIRADGEGGYECAACEPVEEHAQRRRDMHGDDVETFAPCAEVFEPPAAPGPMPTPDEFMSPATVEEPDPLNVSGQPNARYEWYGSQNRGYLVREPDTGDFRRYKNQKPKGLTRATTFNKAASDSKAINDWGKRNIVIGASRRPNVLLQAHGLTHENDRRELERIVAELEEAAGAKVGSDIGTFLHSFTELMDAGVKTWRDAPAQYQRSLALYSQALADAGLEPVPGLIERTTMIREFGGVVGTFDRIFYHRPSGMYVIGDLKTGKTMDYAMDETNTQMWIYAHGVNQNGVYDWNTDVWSREDPSRGGLIARISEDVGVIIHMPVQGPQAGTVQLIHADLQAGARHAELCHAIRSRDRSKVRAWEPPAPEGVIDAEIVYDSDDVEGAKRYEIALRDDLRPVEPTWEERFGAVRSGEEAGALWVQAKAAGVVGLRLNELVAIARTALASRVDSSS